MSCGITAVRVSPVATSLPPITSGISIRSPATSVEAPLEGRALGAAGQEVVDGLVAGGRRPEVRVCAHRCLTRYVVATSTQIMKPSEEAQKVEPTNVQLGRSLADAEQQHGDPACDPEPAEPPRHLAGVHRRER